jgi:hypothetical protein
MKKTKCESPGRDVRIRNVRKEVADSLKHLAELKGITQSNVTKRILLDVIEKFPEDIRNGTRPCEPCREVRITMVSKKAKRELENIVRYYHTDITSFMQSYLELFVAELPANARDCRLKTSAAPGPSAIAPIM